MLNNKRVCFVFCLNRLGSKLFEPPTIINDSQKNKSLDFDITDTFFYRVLINSHHVLQLVLPQQHETQYSLRARPYDKTTLILKTADLNDRDFHQHHHHVLYFEKKDKRMNLTM